MVIAREPALYSMSHLYGATCDALLVLDLVQQSGANVVRQIANTQLG